MLRFEDLYSTDFAAFQKMCRIALQEKVANEGAHQDVFDDYQVHLKSNGGIQKAKYLSTCRFVHPLQVASRGTTWFPDGSWYFTMPKFPNGSQSADFYGRDQETVEQRLLQQGYQFAFMPKWDGSAIHIFRHQGVTYAFTLGSLNREIKMQGAIPDSPTFSELALELFRTQYPDGEAWLEANPGCGLMFEMCSRWNLIVTQYQEMGPRGRLHPLVVVEPDGGLSWRWPDSMKKDHLSWFSPASAGKPSPDEASAGKPSPDEASAGEPSPDEASAGMLGPVVSTKDFANQLMELLVNDSRFGTNPEGLVMYAVKGFAEVHPVFKLKRPEYLESHRTIALQPGSTNDLNNVAEAVLQETYDDWIHPTPEYKAIRDKYRDELEAALEVLVTRLRSLSEDSEQIPLRLFQCLDRVQSRGEFARMVKSPELGLPGWICQHFFRLYTEGLKFSELNEWEFVRMSLLAIDNTGAQTGTTRLSKLQDQSPYWFHECLKLPSQTTEGKVKRLAPEGAKTKEKVGDQPPIKKPQRPAPFSDYVRKIPQSWISSAISATGDNDPGKVPGLAVFDWDRTSAPCRDGQLHEYYDRPETIEPPFPKMVRLMKTYLEAGWRVAVVTGRLYRLESRIHQLLDEAFGGPSGLEVYGATPQEPLLNQRQPTLEFKCSTVQQLIALTSAETCVHFDDDSGVLKNLSQRLGNQVRYVPFLASVRAPSDPTADGTHEPLLEPFVQGHQPVVVVMVGPPGAGKTTVAKHLERLVKGAQRDFFTTGFDKFKLAERRKNAEQRASTILTEAANTAKESQVSSEELYEMVMSELRHNLRPNSVVFLDMCHDGTSLLKRLKQMAQRGQCALFAFTNMELERITLRSKGGKVREEEQVSETYVQTVIARAQSRIESERETGIYTSTLQNPDRVESAVRSRAERCAQVVANPNNGIQRFNELDSQRLAEIVFEQIQTSLTQVQRTHSYLALPINPQRVVRLCGDGVSPLQTRVKLPHVTMYYGTDVPCETIGDLYQVALGPKIANDDLILLLAKTSKVLDPSQSGDPISLSGDHLTVSVAPGIKPAEAKVVAEQMSDRASGEELITTCVVPM